MERVGACLLMAIFSLDRYNEVQGDNQFYMDILEFFGIDTPVFVSTYDYDIDTRYLNHDASSTFIKYAPEKDATEVAKHINELYTLDESRIVMFLDNGHHTLLKILLNEYQLFNKGATGVLQQSDIDGKMYSAMQLDTKLYLYSSTINSTILKEVYSIKGKSVIRNIATWEENVGLSVPLPNIWERRTNMDGMILTVGTINFPVLHELLYDDSNKKELHRHGFFFEVLNILSAKLNFTYKVIPSIDGKWGGRDAKGNWNGLMGMLMREEVDMVAAALTITKERMEVASFSVPFLEGYKTLISEKNLEPDSDLWIYLNIFSTSAWFVSIAVVTAISLGFAGMLHMKCVQSTYESEEFQIMMGLGISLSFFRQIYHEVKMMEISARILFFTSAASSYIIFVHYTACLTAVSTTGITESPIRSFSDVIKNDYKVVLVDSSNEHEILKSSKPGTPMHYVYQNIIGQDPNAMVQSYEKAEEAVYSRKKTLFFGHSLLSIPYDGMQSLEIQGRIKRG